MHPVDVANELKKFSFFKSIQEDLLLSIATMTSMVKFQAGEFILTEGQANKDLYFIRSGVAEVVLAGEVVAILQNPGDVIGDMSVVTEKPVSTTIRAKSEMECFLINSESFENVGAKERDHLYAILYRIYAIVLADRLVKTNEKARLFEVANRELHQAQVALDKIGSKKVLLVENDRKQLVMAKMAVGATGVQMDVASSLDEGLGFLRQNKYDAVICDDSCVQLLRIAHQEKYGAKLVLMTSKDVAKNLQLMKDMLFIDNVITRSNEDRNFTMRMILTTLTKILNNDVFGLEKYLTWGVEIHSLKVTASSERENLRNQMLGYFQSLGIRKTILERCNTVAEEMLMNAIYDAPTDSHGKSIFNHLSRRTEVVLDTHLQSKLYFACDGIFLAVSVVDPFGALTKKIILDYLESCYTGQAGTLNAGKGGAGRGLHQITENADLTIFNIKQNSKTEVICLFHVEHHMREEQPSFHYFFG